MKVVPFYFQVGGLSKVVAVALLLLRCARASGPEALVFNPSTTLSCRGLAGSANGDIRVEFRAHNLKLLNGSSTGLLASFPGYQIRLMGSVYNGPVLFSDELDDFTRGQGTDVYLNPGKSNDVIVRFQRDGSHKTLNAEMWDGNGGNYRSVSLPLDTLHTRPKSQDCAIGGNISLELDYLRWYKTPVPIGTPPFNQLPGDVLDLEFDGTLRDSVSGRQMKVNEKAIFGPSPTYPPLVTQGRERTFTNGSGRLDASQSVSLSGNKVLAYKWEQVSGPSVVKWSSTAVTTPVISGMLFGTYAFRVTVSDAGGLTSSMIAKYGNVSADAAGRVAPTNTWIGELLGPMLPWGASPWPYFDETHKALADFFGGLQDTDYRDVWNQATDGFVSVSKGSTTVTGARTTFRKTFCESGSSPTHGSALIVWYPVSDAPGRTGRRAYGVASCVSDTELLLDRPWTSSASAEHLKYTAMDEHAIGTWINGSSNANYYDNGLAFLNLYIRSGREDYQKYFRTLEDRWWTMPWVDEGRVCFDGEGITCLAPRLQSVTGLIARALDGRPDMWPGIRKLVEYDFRYASRPTISHCLGDTREEGYATAFVAEMAEMDPDPKQRDVWKARVTTLISDHWISAMLPDGSWRNLTFGYASWNGSTGTASVVKGSVLVIGDQTHWDAERFVGASFWTADINGVTNGDKISYSAKAVSPTQLRLDKPYQGPTANRRGWQANSLVGLGTQPFMLGIVGTAFRFAYQATGDKRLPVMIGNIGRWLAFKGFRPATRGLRYGVGFANCEPDPDLNPACSGGTVEESRFLSGEIIGAVSAAYTYSGSPELRAFVDNLYSAVYAKYPTDPGYDGKYVNDFDGPASWDVKTKKAKDFGFHFGFGAGSSWPAARLGSTTKANTNN